MIRVSYRQLTRWFPSRNRRVVVILAILTVASVSTRLMPLSFTPYPFNNDAMTECRVAEDVIATGSWNPIEVNSSSIVSERVTPAYSLMLAFVASSIGTSPFYVAQSIIAAYSALIITGMYLLVLRITKDIRSALASSLVVLTLGTFVFLTGSAWRESLGVAIMMFILVAYIARSSTRFLALECVGLAILPLIHHLVAFLTYSTIGFLTIWSIVFAIRTGRFRRRHFIDGALILLVGAGAYVYYLVSPLPLVFDAIRPIDLYFVFAWLAAFGFTVVLVLAMRTHLKVSFAPIPATLVVILFTLDYFNPLFNYESGAPIYVLILTFSMGILVGLAWFGFEVLLESGSRYRAIPICILAPVLALLGYALTSGLDLPSMKIIYRSFDFAVIAAAIGIGVCLHHFLGKNKNQLRLVTILIVVLLISFPFGFFTDTLTGVRHDTQDYELDATEWICASTGCSLILESDIRLAYNARAMYGCDARPDLVLRLATGEKIQTRVYCMLLEEWTETGVDNYPYGHPTLHEGFVLFVLTSSDVAYIGGPTSNNIVIFHYSPIGWELQFQQQ